MSDQRASDPAAATCPACGTPRPERFCPACGERRIEPDEETALHFVLAAFHGLTNLDSKLWRSLRSFVLRPGELTRDYVAGIRRPHLGPVQLLLVCLLVVFLLGQWLEYRLFTTNLFTQIRGSLHGDWALGVAEAQAARLDLSLNAYSELYDRTTVRFSKALMLILVPVAALLSVVFLLPRRQRFTAHLTLACHFVGWFVIFPGLVLSLVASVLTRLISRAGLDLSDDFLNEAPIVAALVGGSAWWLATAQRRWLGTSRLGAWARALPWTLAFLFLGGSLFRLALFVVTVQALR